jgi:hypothetical protein
VRTFDAFRAAVVAFGLSLLGVLALSCNVDELPDLEAPADAGAVEGGADCTCYHHEIYDYSTGKITVWTDCDPNE